MFVISIITATIITIFFNKMVCKPLQLLAASSKKIAQGDLQVPDVHATTKDEIGDLAKSFNQMKQSL